MIYLQSLVKLAVVWALPSLARSSSRRVQRRWQSRFGILGAVYLHEYGGKSKLSRLIRFMADVMTGVPSIVMGLFVYTVWTLKMGLNGFGGSLALACLMLPIIIRSTEEMLRLVPDETSSSELRAG